jgi:hypothetical protein
MSLYTPKSFPDNYDDRVVSILEALSLSGSSNISVAGSASLRSQLYAGDYDATNLVKASSVSSVATSLKEMVNRILSIEECYFNDIKCGEVPEWNVIPAKAHIANGKIVDFNKIDALKVLDLALEQKAITPAEKKTYYKLIENIEKPLGFLEAKKEIRFHVIRWTSAQILAGELDFRGRHITLEDAIMSKGMIKADVVANIYDRFTECSMIYEVYVKGKLITQTPPPIIRSLQEDIIYYNKREPFKALKRFFSLSKAQKHEKVAEELLPILNGDLGRLNIIAGDLKTLADLLELHNMEAHQSVLEQVDRIKGRLSNIYQLKDYLKGEHEVIGEINSILKAPKSQVLGKLERLYNKLMEIISKATLKIVGKVVKQMT